MTVPLIEHDPSVPNTSLNQQLAAAEAALDAANATNAEFLTRITELGAENIALHKEIIEMIDKCSKLRAELKKAYDDNDRLRDDNDWLRAHNNKLRKTLLWAAGISLAINVVYCGVKYFR